MSQADTVLGMLRERGVRGVHTFEIYDVRIMNPSQRIAELGKRGHIVTSEREQPAPGRAVGARYTLVRDASSAGGDDRDAPSLGGPTDLADTAASTSPRGPDSPCVGGHQAVRDVLVALSIADTPASAADPLSKGAGGHFLPTQPTAPSEQDRPAPARVDRPADPAPSGVGGQLFPDTIVEHTARPHWMEAA